MNYKYKFTVVTVCYNAAEWINKTILSVINQTYSSIEYIIVDGASSDGTVDVIKKYENKITKWISEQDKGIYDAMNKAIDIAEGEWINFMNAGDLFVDNNVLETVTRYMSDENDVIFGNTILENNGKRKRSKGQIKENEFPDLNHQSTFVRTSLMKKYHYNLRYEISADFDFLHKIYKLRHNFYHVNIDIAIYDVSGLSSSNRARLYKEHCDIQEKTPSLYKLVKYKLEDAIPMCIMKAVTRLLYY